MVFTIMCDQVTQVTDPNTQITTNVIGGCFNYSTFTGTIAQVQAQLTTLNLTGTYHAECVDGQGETCEVWA
jgi:hypothetical protein